MGREGGDNRRRVGECVVRGVGRREELEEIGRCGVTWSSSSRCRAASQGVRSAVRCSLASDLRLTLNSLLQRATAS